MTNLTVYTLIKESDGQTLAATYFRANLESHPSRTLCRVESRAIDMATLAQVALAKLSPLERLALGLEV